MRRYPFINCENQDVIDYYWDYIGDGVDAHAQVCGWLKDKIDVSWQVVPIILNEMILDKDIKRANKAMHAMLRMKKLDVAALKAA